MKIRSVLVALSTAAVTVTTCSIPAAADPEVPGWEVTPQPSVAGVADRGWVSTSCAGEPDRLKCQIRMPRGVRVYEIEYVHGGDSLGVEKSWSEVGQRPYGPRPAVTMRPVQGVRVDCEGDGGKVYCTAAFRERVRLFNVTVYGAQQMLGGLKFEAYE